jgi:hypothetical protein
MEILFKIKTLTNYTGMGTIRMKILLEGEYMKRPKLFIRY